MAKTRWARMNGARAEALRFPATVEGEDKMKKSKTLAGFLSLLITCHLSLATVLMMPINSYGQQETPPPPAPPRAVNFPKPIEKTLSNGLRVIFVERAGTSLAT